MRRPLPALALAAPVAFLTFAGGLALGDPALTVALFCAGLWLGLCYDCHTDRR